MKLSKKFLFAILLIFFLAGGFLIYLKNQSVKPTKETREQTQGEEENSIVLPKDLIQCTQELLKQDCEKLPPQTVCGYDQTIYENGEKRNNILEFKSPCHYCRFYGLEEREIGGTKIKGLGYELKSCDQGMYKK